MRRLKGAVAILVTLATAAALAAYVLTHIALSSDIADFLPQGNTPATRLMLQQLRAGPAARLILVGVEGEDPARLASLSRDLRAALIHTGLFAFVENGGAGAAEATTQYVFAHRYALSPAVTPAAFTEAALHADLTRLLEELSSFASPIVSRYGFADPTGSALPLLDALAGAGRPPTSNGVWYDADHHRALLLAETAAQGIDVAAQERVRDAIDGAWAALSPPAGARLLLSGPAIFTLDAARAIRGDVRLISIVSLVLIVALFAWRYRSPLVIAAIGIPLALSVAAASAAVQAIDGRVAGITLGFGLTMLGVSLDYPVLLVGHRRPGEPARATMARIGRTFATSVTMALLGLTGMLLSAFPGLSELGLFAVVGLAAAGLATVLLLAPLLVAADLAPPSQSAPPWLLRVEGWRRHRRWVALLPLAALLILALSGGPHLQRDLARLSPVPASDLALDQQMRAVLGAPDVAALALVEGDDVQQVLAREEALAPLLEQLQQDKVIGGADYAAAILPSVATQQRRLDALPPPAELARRLAAASAGLPYRANVFAAFLRDTAAPKPPVTPETLDDPLLATRVRSLLLRQGDRWYGLVDPREVRDPARLAAALAAAPHTTYLDLGRATDALVWRYTGQALRWLAAGAGLMLLGLAVVLRDPWRWLRVVAPIANAVLVTLAVLALFRIRLSLFHIVALQLLVGVAVDYSVFFARPRLDGDERARTFRTLMTCATMTLLTFGLLAFCRTPLLRGIGITVGTGVVIAFTGAFMITGPLPRETAGE